MTRFVVTACSLLLVSALNSEAHAGSAGTQFQTSYGLEVSRDYGAALEALEALPSSHHGTYLYYLRHGWLSYLAGKHADAVADYKRAVSKAPKAVEPLLGLMLPQMALRQWSDAFATGKSALAIDPHNYLATSRSAFALFNLGRYKEAETLYRKVVERYPSDVEMQSGVAWCLLKTGKKSDAAEMFGDILIVAPNYASAKAGLAASGG